MSRTFLKPTHGFTLIETLVSVAVFVIIGLAVSNFGTQLFSLNSTLRDSLTSQSEARAAFKIMTAEIRSASPSSTGTYAIEAADASTFIFFGDIDDDGLYERIRYYMSGTTLKRGITKPTGNPLTYTSTNETTSDLIHDIVNGSVPLFSYYDSSYDGTSGSLNPISILAIRLVKITTVVDRDPNRAPGASTSTTQVSIRNIKDNL